LKYLFFFLILSFDYDLVLVHRRKLPEYFPALIISPERLVIASCPQYAGIGFDRCSSVKKRCFHLIRGESHC
jgi:hypothetical protein